MSEVRVGRDRQWIPGLALFTQDTFDPLQPLEEGTATPCLSQRGLDPLD